MTMNRQEVEQMIDDIIPVVEKLSEGDLYYISKQIKSFFLDDILPEVLRDVIPSETGQRDSFDRGYNSAIISFKNLAKEKYNITL